MRPNPAGGFTVVELMVVLVIVGVLLAVGLPNFRNSLSSTRVATTTNELNAALAFARSEAMRSTQRSVLCTSSNGTACGGTWNSGWIIGPDANGDGAPESVVRFVQAKEGTAVSVSGGGAPTTIPFDPRGRPVVSGAVSFNVQPASCAAGKPFRRTLVMNASGQIKLDKGNCT